MTLTGGDWPALHRRLSGALILPGDPSWDRARQPQMQRFADVEPLAIVRCADTADVATALEFVNSNQLPIAIRSGGHDFAGRSTSTGVILDTSMVDHVEVSGTTAIIGGGAKLGRVYGALDRYACTIPGGCGATVGIAGLTLGGGLGVLGRRRGLTCDWLRSTWVVLADGNIVTCDERHDADLFWALRGAGAGYFGVVTELVFETVPAPPCVVFELTWDAAQATGTLAAWQAWAPDAPAEMAASLLLNAPADAAQPLQVTVLGAVHDTDADTATSMLTEFVTAVGHAPQTKRQWSVPWLEAKDLLARLAPSTGSGFSYSKSEFHDRPLPADAIDQLVTGMISNRVPGEARELDFSPWAGAYNAAAVDATAFPHRGARFLLKHVATIVTDASGTAPPTRHPRPGPWFRRSWQTAHRHGTGGVYPNFPDPDLADPDHAYFGPNLPRLITLKRLYDPGGVLAPLGTRAAALRHLSIRDIAGYPRDFLLDEK
jgi:FAD/FMN-containing dehydrogenase